MRIKSMGQLVFLVLAVLCTTVRADVVILKSGELFQTRKAWTQNGQVSFYRGDRIVHVQNDDVERLIHTTTTATKATKRPEPISDEKSEPVHPKTASRNSFPAPRPDGDNAGHLDLHWGAAASRIDGLEPVGTDPAYGGVSLYAFTKRKRFGRAQVDRIHLGFWRDKLYTITVWTSNFLDFKELKAEAFRRYGKGHQNREDVERFHWVEEETDRLLSYDFESDTGYLWMRSTRVHRLVKERGPE